MSKYCVIGRHGLIGAALARKLGEVTPFPTDDTGVLFHLGSYVHPEFEKNPEYHMKQTIDSFTSLLPYCRARGILFVYPSSALVYEEGTQFSRFKRLLEQLASCYGARTLGLRIFPTYGPGESRTVISKWCRQMMAGERPEVYGDGEQFRDFIYVDDVVRYILAAGARMPLSASHWVLDIGSGVPTSFNRIVQIINSELGTSIVPNYTPRPAGYASGIVCKRPVVACEFSIEAGIRNVLASLKTSTEAACASVR